MHIEYKEFEATEKIIAFLDAKIEMGEDPMLFLDEAGYFTWLSEMSKDGWRPIWQTYRFPKIVLEREVE